MNMNFKNFSKLYVTDFNLSKMLVMNQQWQTNSWFIRKKPRATKRRVAKDIKKISGVTIAVAPLSPFLRTFLIAYFIH